MPARQSARTEHDETEREQARASAPVTLLTGLALAVGVVVLTWLDSALDLQVGPVVLAGVALGAVVAMVPVGAAGQRLAGFAIGVVLTLACYLVRALALPDTAAGLGAMAVLAVVLCTVVALLSLGRLPLWTLLLGAGAFAGVYERTFAAATPEALTTSVNTVTALALTVAVGFLLGCVVPQPGTSPAPRAARRTQTTTDSDAPAGAHSLEGTR